MIKTLNKIGMALRISDDHTRDEAVRGKRFPHRLAAFGKKLPRQFATAPVPQSTN